jgi:hypothetical protein
MVIAASPFSLRTVRTDSRAEPNPQRNRSGGGPQEYRWANVYSSTGDCVIGDFIRETGRSSPMSAPGATEVKIKTGDGDVVTNTSGVLFAVALDKFL